VKGNKESLLCMGTNVSILEANELLSKIDDFHFRFDFQNIAILKENKQCLNRFPIINIKEPFWQFNFNKHLFENFELAKKLFLIQSDIKNIIVNSYKPRQFVVLIIIDGLSFMDCRTWNHVSPCLVDTISNTECGFHNIIGLSKSIGFRLFQKKLSNFVGFTYWDKSNELTKNIFKNIPNLFKIERFFEIFKEIENTDLCNTYIQIVLSGLDGIAHKYRDEPPIKAIVQLLYEQFEQLFHFLEKFGLQGNLFVTSDHGILWKHKENLTEITPDITSGKTSPRYYYNKINSPRVCNFHITGKYFSALKYPFVTRKLRSNEWGTHGGVSLAESIVPFLHWKIN
jgi:hypothetical protein